MLNEVDGLQAIIPLIKKEWVDQILFVDGGSADGTLDSLKKNNCEYIAQKRRGLRHAYSEALPHIRGDALITFSPDGNSIPGRIPDLIAKYQEGYDMVICSRFTDGAKSEEDDIVTKFGNWFFTTMINLLFRGAYTDALVMYRIYRTSLLCELDIDKDSSYQFEERLFRTVVGCEPLISMRAAKHKLKCADKGGDEPARIAGEGKASSY